MFLPILFAKKTIISVPRITSYLFSCKNCGYKSNDDRIGAMNLYRMGINYLEDSQVPDTVATE